MRTVNLKKPTLDADEVATLLDVSTWTLYEQVKKETLPPELMPLRVGRAMRWPTSRVISALGIERGTRVAG
jgi:predicted DNA-binding transcriptional regulator AlpA